MYIDFILGMINLGWFMIVLRFCPIEVAVISFVVNIPIGTLLVVFGLNGLINKSK
jgi:hypothetical protein